MVVLGGEKYGLYISMTRIVYFDEIPEEIYERYQKTHYVFACMQQMMHEGMECSEYLQMFRSSMMMQDMRENGKCITRAVRQDMAAENLLLFPGLIKNTYGTGICMEPNNSGNKM